MDKLYGAVEVSRNVSHTKKGREADNSTPAPLNTNLYTQRGAECEKGKGLGGGTCTVRKHCPHSQGRDTPHHRAPLQHTHAQTNAWGGAKERGRQYKHVKYTNT